MKRKQCKLLPHKRTDLYGLDRSSIQFYPWPIKTFDIEKSWRNSQGEGVRIAVIDTGCDLNHEDIKDNLLDGINLVNTNKDPIDDNGHGTHVSGTISASNNSIGMVGIAPKAKIIPVKALDGDGRGDNKNVTRAILWAVERGADIITMSLGSEYPSSDMENAIKYAKSKNVVIFCAAGNSGIDSGIQYPAKYSTTISIGAINEQLEICEFSCCGPELDFLAPGYNIISAVPGNSYASMSGTSMATPFAVGCAALLLSYVRKNPNSAIDNMLRTREDYIAAFARGSLKLQQKKYAGKRNYEGNGIIKPII